MFKGGNLTFTFLRKYEALWNLEQSQIHKYAKYGPHWNHGKKSEIRKYAKYAKYGPLWNYGKNLKYVNTLNTGYFEIMEKNLKYVNTSNTGHFEILKKNLKYVNTSNTLNTEYFKILKEKSQIRKYVKYAKYGPLWNLEEKIWNK